MRRLNLSTQLGHIASMAPARKKTISIALALEEGRLLSLAARERGVSRPEFYGG